jgi:hypothetical protein
VQRVKALGLSMQKAIVAQAPFFLNKMPRRKSKRGSNFEASLCKRGSVNVKHNAGRERHVQDPSAPRPREEKQEHKSQPTLQVPKQP